MKSNKGFTLIEILVTISIIALLTMIGITNFKVANQKSRDGRRQGDLEQLKAALELYRTDAGSYPSSGSWLVPGGSLSYSGTTYIQNIPDDPISSRSYYYTSPDGGNTYRLCAALELDTSGSCSGASCGSGVTCNYQINSPL
jgi:general secretion pathway protein G